MNKIKKAFIWLMLIIVCIFILLPVYWMFTCSIKDVSEIYNYPPTIFPKVFSFRGYYAVFDLSNETFSFLKWFWNSFLVSIANTILALIAACLGGYALSRFRFKGKKAISYSILITQVIPGTLLMLPLYIIIVDMKLINTHWALILTYTTMSLPFCTWMMKGFFDTIPKSLDESARIDGCNRFKAFLIVVLPLALPGLISTIIFSFIQSWNEFPLANVFMRKYEMWTLPVGLTSFKGQHDTKWDALLAGGMITTVPVVILFWSMQKYLVSGMTAGAVKQ
jgi:ABC-type glycerol-3-phosphate transport system permease component